MDYRLRTLLASGRLRVVIVLAAGISIVFGMHLSAILDTVIILAVTGGAAVALLASARSRERRWVALPLAAAAIAWTIGWAFWQWNILATGLPPGPGSPGDAFLIGYPLVALALLRIERRRSNTQGRALDVAILTVAAANLTWLFVVDPLVLDNTALSIYARGIQCAYLLCNVLVFVGAARLATTSWPQPRSTMLLTLGAVSLLIGDVPWNWLTLTATTAEAAHSPTPVGLSASSCLHSGLGSCAFAGSAPHACRTCLTTNVIGLATAGVMAAGYGVARFARRRVPPS